MASPAASADSIACLLYSSDAERRWRGAMLQHRALASVISAAVDELGLTEQDVVLAVAPPTLDVSPIELLAPQPADRALDLFCGLGNFSLPLAMQVASVDGVEVDAALVARARANAARNGITNAAFHAADLAAMAQQGAWSRAAYDLVLLDPPRAGAREVLPVAVSSRPRRIVYVSCHPGSFARDAGILTQELGYGLVAAGIMDMFPHTSHVESIALFEPRR